MRNGWQVRRLRDDAIFDVVDGNDQHLFYFLTQVTGGYLFFNYGIAGSLQYAYVPQGNEDTQFGNGVTLKVKLTWDGSMTNLYLNDTLVKSAPYTIPVANWTAGSVFDLGAHEYQTWGGFNTLDDVIDEFTVTGTAAIVSDTTPPVVSVIAPVNGATVSGIVTVTANATDNTGVTRNAIPVGWGRTWAVSVTWDRANLQLFLGHPRGGRRHPHADSDRERRGRQKDHQHRLGDGE